MNPRPTYCCPYCQSPYEALITPRAIYRELRGRVYAYDPKAVGINVFIASAELLKLFRSKLNNYLFSAFGAEPSGSQSCLIEGSCDE